MPDDGSSRGGQGPPDDAEHDLAGALHDVSNALTLVVGWLDRARAQVGPADVVREPIEMALARAREGRAIARRAVGAPVGEGHRRTLEDVVHGVAASLAPALDERAVRLEIELVGGEVALRAPYAVVQILTNMLLNAAAFSPPGGVVRLNGAYTEGQPQIFLRIADQGPGIAPENRASLFVRGATTRESGAGIGLAYARSLAQGHDGDLTAEAPPRGASFLLCWPAPDAAPASRPGTVPPPSARIAIPRAAASVRVELPPATPSVRAARVLLSGKRVLIVEDDDAVMALLDTALTVRGAIVVGACSVNELANVLQAEAPFDAALVDLSPLAPDPLPHLDALKLHSPTARLVAVSGSSPPAGAPPLMHVRKPFELAEVVEALTAPTRNGA